MQIKLNPGEINIRCMRANFRRKFRYSELFNFNQFTRICIHGCGLLSSIIQAQFYSQRKRKGNNVSKNFFFKVFTTLISFLFSL